jgi:deoxyadenosine/deoxycytidine kinase
LIYHNAPASILIERIRSRGRAIEGSITEDYLTLLESFYTDWIASFDICPILTIHTGQLGKESPLDFVHNPRHLDIVVERIQDMLAGKEDVIFPNGQ